MKFHLSFFICFSLIACNSETHDQIISEKYIEGFYRTKYELAQNIPRNKDASILYLIDKIIEDTNTLSISIDLRKQIVSEIDKFSVPRFNYDLNRLDELINALPQFEKGSNSFLEDLDFIDDFLVRRYWQYWQCNMGVYGLETLVSLDTLLLFAETDYEVPIRVEYNQLPSSMFIISNSLQGSKPNRMKFKTDKAIHDFQKIEYECEALNKVSGEAVIYRDSLVIRLVERN